MKRLFCGAFLSALALFVGLVGLEVVACDPDLTPAVTPGTAPSEAGTEAGPTGPPAEAGTPTTEGGVEEGGSEAGIEHKVDGTNDFALGEKFGTSSPNYDGYVAWDETKVYFGMSGDDIGGGAGAGDKWVLIYVDGNPGNAGTTTGIGYDCGGTCTSQAAHLSFNAGYHLRWKADGNYTNLQKWDGTKWSDVGPISTAARMGNFMELSITRAALGSPTKLKVHVNMLIEKSGAEWTYAGIPSASFTDGINPATFSKYFEFDLTDATKAPNTYAPKP